MQPRPTIGPDPGLSCGPIGARADSPAGRLSGPRADGVGGSPGPRSGGPAGRPTGRRGRGLVGAITLLCVGIEGLLQLSDRGLIPARGLRENAYALGAFWPGLLGPGLFGDSLPGGGGAVYPGQAALMFLSYGALHDGLLHLGCNMLALWSLGPRLVERMGPGWFAAIWLGAQVAGGLAYAALSDASQPMVGASGALFGLAGALVADLARHRRARGISLRPLGGFLAMLVALNGLTAAAFGGSLAWQAHLGGFLAGAALAMARPDPRRPSRPARRV